MLSVLLPKFNKVMRFCNFNDDIRSTENPQNLHFRSKNPFLPCRSLPCLKWPLAEKPVLQKLQRNPLTRELSEGEALVQRRKSGSRFKSCMASHIEIVSMKLKSIFKFQHGIVFDKQIKIKLFYWSVGLGGSHPEIFSRLIISKNVLISTPSEIAKCCFKIIK